ncbi:MAG TPA: hypothetical protein VGQ08_18585 [Nitrospiraceae bacterium]|jgi:hypothetical protein|nr:hypothetical protein [Nitrospiraceae bacterium]
MIRPTITPCFSVSNGSARRQDEEDPITGRDKGERMTHYCGAKAILERIGLYGAWEVNAHGYDGEAPAEGRFKPRP